MFVKSIINTDSKNQIIDEAIELKGLNWKVIDKRNSKVKGDVFIYPIPLTQTILIKKIV